MYVMKNVLVFLIFLMQCPLSQSPSPSVQINSRRGFTGLKAKAVLIIILVDFLSVQDQKYFFAHSGISIAQRASLNPSCSAT